ncbi:riboflavin synthase [Natronospora cellulosivora (SeqCode)]
MCILFTGIIQEVGVLKEKIRGDNSYQLLIEGNKVLKDINKGDSIAVNGVCLTVVEYSKDSFTADIMPETLRATNLKNCENGDRVNLEQAVRADGFLGGHIVSGHVDGIGNLKKIRIEKNARILEIAVESELIKYMVDKGSVTLNGISLTIVKVFEESFTVSLIPETWNFTNLKEVDLDGEINIETDLIGKYVFKMLNNKEIRNRKSNISKDFLRENGFV